MNRKETHTWGTVDLNGNVWKMQRNSIVKTLSTNPGYFYSKKQNFSAAEFSYGVDCHQEGFFKGREWWQSMAMPWRKGHLDRQNGNLPEVLPQLPLTHTMHTHEDAGTQTKTWARTFRLHACTLNKSSSSVPWGFNLACEDFFHRTGKINTWGCCTYIAASCSLHDR